MIYEIAVLPESTEVLHVMHFGNYRSFCILRDGEPYLRIETEEAPLWVEEDAALFGTFLLLGTQDFVYGIRLDDLSVQEFPVNLYFKEFLVTENAVYVFDAMGIFALDRELHILWQNRDLAVDGVLPLNMPDAHTLRISCEMDPPGGWVEKTISLDNGTLLN